MITSTKEMEQNEMNTIYRIETVCPTRSKVLSLRWNESPKYTQNDGCNTFIRSVPHAYVNGGYKHFPTTTNGFF